MLFLTLLKVREKALLLLSRKKGVPHPNLNLLRFLLKNKEQILVVEGVHPLLLVLLQSRNLLLKILPFESSDKVNHPKLLISREKAVLPQIIHLLLL